MMKICSVILAGGQSTRMGTNKSFLPLQNKTVIEYIVDEMQSISDVMVINSNEPASYSFLGLPVIQDRYINSGPLAGLEAVLSQVDAEIFFVSACDTPFINHHIYLYLLDQLEGFDAVIPIYKGKMHPLSGIYRNTIVPPLQNQLDNEERKVRLLFDHVHVNYIDEFANISNKDLEKHFFNMNNQTQYEEAKRL
ncbi:molybdenum cofactor guanylyltransferase [Virgibacillus necropolis]|uniref:Probable molybdenum cofactor guanylyltransferase n=1 Tax=Virgibacillus necropolis TaxID=163877 RepID=A0A221MCZ4_9BACI|nr:molybdenum cofactor guanylyltransferase [Virgibacillus necropolis]ASN05558.1 molybdenum cofactor guanylyltransferase [Virgibacillus necropolis]